MKQKKGRHTIDTQSASTSLGTLGDIFQRSGIAASKSTTESATSNEPPPPNESEAHKNVSSSKPLNIVASRLRVRCERKHRGGKTVTIIEGISSDRALLEIALKQLKAALGCGGAIEDDALVLQGDLRQRALKWIEETAGVSALR